MNIYHITIRPHGHRYGDSPILATFYMQRDMNERRLLKELRVQQAVAKGLMLDDPLQETYAALERTAKVFRGRVEFEELSCEINVDCSESMEARWSA